ncbi:hypothetical protein [Nocardioides pakistanensis]
MSITKAPKRVRFDVPADHPRLAQAVSLGLAVVRHTKHKTWGDLVRAINADDPGTLALLAQVDITAEESDLLADASTDYVLRLVRTAPLLTVAVCPECQAWVLLQGGAPPTRCKVTLRCTGKPVKASIAAKQKPDEDADPETETGPEPTVLPQSPGATPDSTVVAPAIPVPTDEAPPDEGDLEDFD